MIKHMAPGDPQRKKLVQADEIASKIALAEADEQTKQAAIWYCLSATVDGFPPGIISNSRRYIDCIDVEDVMTDPAMSSSAPGSTSMSAGSLHCTLFLFDDKLVIAKRPGNGERSGRILTGLDEMEKLAKAGGLPIGMKKSGMTFKGVVDIADVVAADVGGAGRRFKFKISSQYLIFFHCRSALVLGEPPTRPNRSLVRSFIQGILSCSSSITYQPRSYSDGRR
jgi:hypothetical protein